jgi:hypothetical protein
MKTKSYNDVLKRYEFKTERNKKNYEVEFVSGRGIKQTEEIH